MKKTRGLKKHYRRIRKNLINIPLHLDDKESWYNMWHVHVEGKGISNISLKHRRSHIKELLNFLDGVEDHSRNSKLPFQTWIHIDAESGTCDSLYIHTPNPHTEYPYIIATKITKEMKVDPMFAGIIDEKNYENGINIRAKLFNNEEKFRRIIVY
ncbi:hypothetical protein [Paenibacillus durus]|uniref:Uncharacterized protein n=2 Tax=Paenibacillus durus TaxID=44251 RepID=A0A0F7FBL0_PAEDU|nr:hypothetical protein [Paenibacillus durus]AKG36180.1 hypothetical protein VK70_17760 [Paenibacillus durus ATCC 35681]